MEENKSLYFTVQLLYRLLMAASGGGVHITSSWLRTAGPWGRRIKKHVKSMRVFLFPDLVFPCSLILPLSGVSAQVSVQFIGPDWDGRNSWSALTGSPMIFFVCVCKQRSKRGCFLSVLVDTHSGVCRLLLRSKGKFYPLGAKVLHLSCYSKPPACKVVNISLNIISLRSLSDINNNNNSYITSEISRRSIRWNLKDTREHSWPPREFRD